MLRPKGPRTPDAGVHALASARGDGWTFAGSPEGLRQAYEAHGPEIHRFCRRSLGDRGQADEATQETFLRAWRAAGRWDPHLGSLRTWLFSIARNVVTDMARARGSRPRLATQTEATLEPMHEFLEGAMRGWVVEEALRRIRADQRQAIVGTYFSGRPYAELAAELGVPEGTLRSRVFYGLKALRLALEEMGWNDG